MKSSSFANAQSYTFVVNDVELAQSLLPTEKPKQLIESVLKYPLEACSNYSRNLLSGISTNPLVTAAKLAFDQHRPLVLYPDAIWLTLVQGISEHIVAQGESISRRILRFGEGRIEIPVSTDSFPIGSLENPWTKSFLQHAIRCFPMFATISIGYSRLPTLPLSQPIGRQ